MNMTFHGAARSVTGSRHVIRTGSSRLLLDCGMFQGRREQAAQRKRRLGFDPVPSPPSVSPMRIPGTAARGRMGHGADFCIPTRRRARVVWFNGFSAHADQNDLLVYVRAIQPLPQKVFVVHGEERQSLAFAMARQTEFPGMGVVMLLHGSTHHAYHSDCAFPIFFQ